MISEKPLSEKIKYNTLERVKRNGETFTSGFYEHIRVKDVREAVKLFSHDVTKILTLPSKEETEYAQKFFFIIKEAIDLAKEKRFGKELCE